MSEWAVGGQFACGPNGWTNGSSGTSVEREYLPWSVPVDTINDRASYYRWLYTGVMTPEQLKRRRARMGLTQSDLSKALGVALTTVGRWEIGQRRIPEMAVRLIDRLQRENRKREVTEPERG